MGDWRDDKTSKAMAAEEEGRKKGINVEGRRTAGLELSALLMLLHLSISILGIA